MRGLNDAVPMRPWGIVFLWVFLSCWGTTTLHRWRDRLEGVNRSVAQTELAHVPVSLGFCFKVNIDISEDDRESEAVC